MCAVVDEFQLLINNYDLEERGKLDLIGDTWMIVYRECGATGMGSEERLAKTDNRVCSISGTCKQAKNTNAEER